MKNLESSKSKFAKMKIPKLSIKKALLGYFLPGIWKNYWHIWNQCPQFCLTANFSAKMKTEINNALFWYALTGHFWYGILRSYYHTVKPLNSGHLQVLKNLSVIERCPLLGGNFKKIVTFGTKRFVRYSWHVRCLGCPLLGGLAVFEFNSLELAETKALKFATKIMKN